VPPSEIPPEPPEPPAPEPPAPGAGEGSLPAQAIAKKAIAVTSAHRFESCNALMHFFPFCWLGDGPVRASSDVESSVEKISSR